MACGHPKPGNIICPDCNGSGIEVADAFFVEDYDDDHGPCEAFYGCAEHGSEPRSHRRGYAAPQFRVEEEHEHACCTCEGEGEIEDGAPCLNHEAAYGRGKEGA